jgi:hypothetical protein
MDHLHEATNSNDLKALLTRMKPMIFFVLGAAHHLQKKRRFYHPLGKLSNHSIGTDLFGAS